MTCGLGEPFKPLSENILRRNQRKTSAEIVTFNDTIYNEALVDLDTQVHAMGGQRTATFCLPQPDQAANNLAIVHMQGTSSCTEEMTAYISDNEHKPMEDQLCGL